MEKQQSILYSKSYDLNLEILKEVSKAMANKPEFSLWFHKLVDNVSMFGTASYLAQEIVAKSSLSMRLYTTRKYCYQSMYYLSLLRDAKGIDKKVAESMLLKMTEVLKLVGASLSTMKKNRKDSEED